MGKEKKAKETRGYFTLTIKMLAIGIVPVLLSTIVSIIVAAVTVGGKAFGKSIAMQNSVQIVHTAAKIVFWFHTLLCPSDRAGSRQRK